MSVSTAFSVLSCLFGSVSKNEWDEILLNGEWAEFVKIATPLLDENSAKAISTPPSFEQLHSISSRCFTGGLPSSAMPVESLYEEKNSANKKADFAPAFYFQDSALYMNDLISALQLELPEAFRCYPDHLSIELDVAAFLLEAHAYAEASDFIQNRFLWLERYRSKLLSIPVDASFYCVLIDSLIAIRDAWPLSMENNTH